MLIYIGVYPHFKNALVVYQRVPPNTNRGMLWLAVAIENF